MSAGSTDSSAHDAEKATELPDQAAHEGLCPVLASADLFPGSEKAIVIEHNGLHYRLQKTRQGKLILTK